MITLDEARAHQGAEVTHHASGVIELVTAQYVWVRWRGAAAAQPVHPGELTLSVAAAEPVDGAG